MARLFQCNMQSARASDNLRTTIVSAVLYGVIISVSANSTSPR